jgi:D-alanyl-D-alanine carboxypeptidase/D-alanyl-D-alanine-endopeptidase (penicillin-binding protein 4)
LIIVGGGDPLISGRFRDNITAVLVLWADSLKAKGIKEIKGDIVVDNSFFNGHDLGPGWGWDDLSYWYACRASALSFNDNCVDLKFLPGDNIGDSAIIEITPNTDYINITNNAVTAHPDSEFTLDYYRKPFTNDVEFFGGIPLSDTAGEVDYVSVYRPELFCAEIFSDILNQNNIKFDGRILALTDMKNTDSANYNLSQKDSLFSWQSDSMGVIISVINKRSQNFFAEQTVLAMGREICGDGNYKTGLGLIETFFDSLGITSDDLAIYDGSGLSHQNLVKPNAITGLLKLMSKGKYSETYYESIRIPRKHRLRNIEFRENVRVKGGTIANTRTYSGYVSGPKTKHLLAFSIMVNNYSCPKRYVEHWQDKIIKAILEGY